LQAVTETAYALYWLMIMPTLSNATAGGKGQSDIR
jgi:hypothetical protein